MCRVVTWVSLKIKEPANRKWKWGKIDLYIWGSFGDFQYIWRQRVIVSDPWIFIHFTEWTQFKSFKSMTSVNVPFVQWLLSGMACKKSITKSVCFFCAVSMDYETQASISPVTIFSTRWLCKLVTALKYLSLRRERLKSHWISTDAVLLLYEVSFNYWMRSKLKKQFMMIFSCI